MTHPRKNCRGHFYFDPEDPIYQDHFPGYPVVPGSLIIHAFMEEAGNSSMAPDPWFIRNFRFKRFITPGRYAYRMQVRKDGRLACTLYDQDTEVATSTL